MDEQRKHYLDKLLHHYRYLLCAFSLQFEFIYTFHALVLLQMFTNQRIHFFKHSVECSWIFSQCFISQTIQFSLLLPVQQHRKYELPHIFSFCETKCEELRGRECDHLDTHSTSVHLKKLFYRGKRGRWWNWMEDVNVSDLTRKLCDILCMGVSCEQMIHRCVLLVNWDSSGRVHGTSNGPVAT